MNRRQRLSPICHLFLLSLAGAAAGVAQAQPAAPVQDSARPALEVRVIEDDAVRIEEVRQRGQVRRITVQNKAAGTLPYEILVGAGGRDPSQDKSGAGQRVWSLLRF